MAKLPPLNNSRLAEMVYAARAAEANDWDGLGFSPSMLDSSCDKFLWLSLRWAFPKEKIGGRQHLLFDSGHYHEAKMVEGLRRAGLELHEVDPDTGKQFPVRALADHLRGKMDGRIDRGVPEAPEKLHLFEAKSHGEKSWKALIKGPTVKEGKFAHWVQMQVYMGITGIDRCLYGAVCKSTDELHFERVRFDHEFYTRLITRLDRILRTSEPPAGICKDAKDFQGMFCRARALCFEFSFARVNCRTCVHSNPEMTGNAAWSCARHVQPINADQQREACPNHLYIPQLVPGEMLDVSEDAETIQYRLHDGRTWTDGEDRADAPIAVEANPND
jgi:hypothetical protein